MGKVRSENRIYLPAVYPNKAVLTAHTRYLNQAIHFPTVKFIKECSKQLFTNSSLKLIIFLSLVLLFLFTFCNDNPVTPELSNSYFPIQLGNSWTFELTYYDTVQMHAEVTYSITKHAIINSKEYFAFDKWPPFIYYPLAHYFNMDSIFVRNDGNGNVMMIADGKEFMFIKFDASLTDTTLNIVDLYDRITKTISIWQSMIYNVNLVMETEQRKLTDGFRISFWEYNTVGSQRDVFFFRGFGIVRMYYFAYSMDWKLKEAVINGKKTEKIISYPNF